MTMRVQAKEMLVCAIITFHEVFLPQAPNNAKNNINVHINENLSDQDNACKWCEVVP
jgi:hypothetical protein